MNFLSSQSLEAGLRWRLVVAMSVVWLSACALAAAVLWHETNEVFDSALTENAQRLLVLPAPVLAGDQTAPLVAEVGEHEEKVIYQVQDAQHQVRLRSHRAPNTALAAHLPDGSHNEGGWRLAVVTRDDGQRRAISAEPLAHRYEVLRGTLLALCLPLLVLLPLHQLGQALDARAAHELDEFPWQTAPQELQPMLHALNRLLARVRQLLQAEQSFASHAAHEMRTPLAAARAQAQRLLQSSDDPKVAERAQAFMRQIDRLQTFTTRLLDLARIPAAGLRSAPVNLPELAHLVLEEMALSDVIQLRIQSSHQAECSVLGDADLLAKDLCTTSIFESKC